MPTRRALVCVCAVATFVMSATAMPVFAQYSGTRATGENYHVEFSGSLWNPSPNILINSESISGIIGSDIDFVEDLGIEKQLVHTAEGRAAPGDETQIPFRVHAHQVRRRSGAEPRFDLQRHRIPGPRSRSKPSSTGTRIAFRYEYDFFYRDRGFVGLVLEAKYTDVEASLTNALDFEFVHARAPIPAVGFIGRGYVAPNISITGEFTFFKLPEIQANSGRYFDLDLYGTVNFTDNVGAQGGYRSFDVVYKVENDNGTLRLKGLYFGGVVRF